VAIHDTRGGDLVCIPPREWAILREADGTRDIGGICLAAARAGAYRKRSEVRALLAELHERGLLGDGIEHAPPKEEPIDRPLDVLGDFSLHCDASGVCCGMYGSILFTPAEAARARALLPRVLDAGAEERRAFTPGTGACHDDLAVAMIDGRCAYLADSGRCAIHAAGGESAKPRACRAYPATFVDDGESVRVSVGIECACVLASRGRTAGSRLVPDGAARLGDLEPGTHVVRLHERIALAPGLSASRADLVLWSRALLSSNETPDSVAALWSLADAILRDRCLRMDSATQAWTAPCAPDAAALAPFIEALAARVAGRKASTEAWRSAKDRARITCGWLAEAVFALREPANLTAALAESPSAAEAFYVRAGLHGHHFVDDVPLERALRDRAVRIVVARALGPTLMRLAPSDPSAAHPLALVEGMMRGHGLKAYAREIAV
jgi:lysine-N-methylase